MSELAKPLAEWCAAVVETIGIFLITAVSLYSIYLAAREGLRGEHLPSVFQTIRHRLGVGILLGLEFLVAADIVHTVAVELTFETVGVLAVIVLIRTFLSFSLEMELTGAWPWQGKQSEGWAKAFPNASRDPRQSRDD